MFRLVGLRKVYPGGLEALKGIDLDVGAGEVLAVIGPSGAGKSTLMRCLTRLVEPTAGRVWFDQQEVTGLGQDELRRVRRQVGMIFQQFQLVKRLTVFQNVLTGRLGYAHPLLGALGLFSVEDRRRAIRALDRVGMLSAARQRADTLSGGQQQRVGIARALVQEPRALLADEPIASLDPANSEQVMSILAALAVERGQTVVVSLHQVEYAREHASRVVGLSRGEVCFDGRPAELTDQALRQIYAGAGPSELVQAGLARSAESARLRIEPARGSLNG
jgi:phosphonate transport system ATP-binding protein